jgi:transcriptional regulator with XRE-family HTH domain
MILYRTTRPEWYNTIMFAPSIPRPDAAYPTMHTVRIKGDRAMSEAMNRAMNDALNDRERRKALADFLRTRRARLSPADVGLPPGSLRRTPGLRREEVAQLAHIGVSWYTALEQGRDVRASEQVLGSLAEALRLSPAEKRHLFRLALPGPEPRSPAGPPQEKVSEALRQAIHALNPHPAYVMGRRWDLLEWNRAAELVFSFSSIAPPHHRNLLWRMFTHPGLRAHQDWRKLAHGVVSQFRADSARYPGDPAFAGLVEDLMETSAEFRAIWELHDVREPREGVKRMDHPAYGRLVFHHVTLQIPEQPDCKLVLYTCTGETAQRLSDALQGHLHS